MNLDFRLFSVIYTQCKSLGGAFGYGWFEGMVIYAGTIMWGINTVLNAKKVQK